MAVNVIVTGLPADAHFPKLMYAFKAMFKKIQIKKFWIRELSETYGVNEKQMTIEFNGDSEARKARNYLDNYPFPHPMTKEEYMLSAHIDDGMEQAEYHEERRWEGERRPRQARPAKRDRARQRSPSPGYRSEASKLDLEIELLRKQRQVIEEERRLLLERKKLDMIREYGPSASRDFMDYDDMEPRRKRRLPPAPMEVKKPRKRSPPPPKPSAQRNSNTLPAFFQPCKKLITDMKQLIGQSTTSEEKEILIKLIRAALRKNLAIALEGKEYMPTTEIIKLYRRVHPKTGDEAFVGKILANIRASYLPDELESKLASVKKAKLDESLSIKKEVDAEGENPSDSKVGENSKEKQEVNETELQDKPANGDETDFSIDVKVEPDTSQKLIDKPAKTANNTEDLPQANDEVTNDETPNKTAEEVTNDEASNKTAEEVTNDETPNKTAEVVTNDETPKVEDKSETKDEATTNEPADNAVEESTETKSEVTVEPQKSEEKAEVQKSEDGEAAVPASQS